MIDILEFLHPYVPCHDPETTRKPVKVLSGGDYLTSERHKEAQSSMQDARTPSSRLEVLIPKVEDFHNQAVTQQLYLRDAVFEFKCMTGCAPDYLRSK